MMRHLMMGGAMAGGFAGWMMMRMINRIVHLVVIFGLVALVVYFWAKSRRRNDW